MASPENRAMRLRGQLAQERKWVDMNVIKGMANPLRNQVLAILNERDGSKTELASELGFDWGEVSYEIEVLEKIGLVKRVAEKRNRGAMEIFYRATTRAYLDPSEWAEVADPVKSSMRASLFQNIMVDAVAALSEGTYDSLPDVALSHMSWTPMIVDDQGWKDLMAVLLCALLEALDIQEECKERLRVNDLKGISCTISMLGFPSANPKRKVGPPIDAKALVDLADQMGLDVKSELKKRRSKRKSSPPGEGKRQSRTQPPRSRRKQGK